MSNFKEFYFVSQNRQGGIADVKSKPSGHRFCRILHWEKLVHLIGRWGEYHGDSVVESSHCTCFGSRSLSWFESTVTVQEISGQLQHRRHCLCFKPKRKMIIFWTFGQFWQWICKIWQNNPNDVLVGSHFTTCVAVSSQYLFLVYLCMYMKSNRNTHWLLQKQSWLSYHRKGSTPLLWRCKN